MVAFAPPSSPCSASASSRCSLGLVVAILIPIVVPASSPDPRPALTRRSSGPRRPDAPRGPAGRFRRRVRRHESARDPRSQRARRGPAAARPVRQQPRVLRRRQLQHVADRLLRPGDHDRPAGRRHRPHGAGDGDRPPARPGRVRRRRRRAGDGVRPRPAAHDRRRPARRRRSCWPCSSVPASSCSCCGRRASGSSSPTSPSPTCSSSPRSCSSARRRSSSPGAASATSATSTCPTPAGPVVFVVLDELPAATIMRADGSLNDERYPGFAELASVSTWFRNASSQYNLTHRAVPALLDGTPRRPRRPADRTPTTRATCSPCSATWSPCAATSRSPTCARPTCARRRRASRSARRSRTPRSSTATACCPSALRDELPAIDNSWGSYGAADEPDDDLVRQVREATDDGVDARRPGLRQVAGPAPPTSAARSARRAILREEIAAITGEPALHVVHVALPHRPWVLSRTGRTTVVRAGADHRSRRAGLRLRRPHGVPAAQHAGRRRRHARRRARRPPAVAAALGGHARSS